MTHLDTLWVRHGESTWNRAGVMQGQTYRPPLTSHGTRQASAAAEDLRRFGPARIVSSDLRRAAETARIIGVRLALPVEHTPLLRERCWGVFEGRPAAEGHQAEAVLSADQAVPQGESRADVAARLRRWLPSLSTPQVPIVVVTHGDVIREAIRLWAGARQNADHLENGCIIRISADIDAHSTRSKHA